MAPYLRTVKSFADVNTEGGVDTLQFLEASEGLVGLLDLLGSAPFAVVQADLKGNITKVKARYNAVSEKSKTLESLVENEKGEKKRTATEGLLWLLRGLSFTCGALQKVQADKKQELAAAFSKSYEENLKQFHNFVVKGIFSVAMKACPYRVDFFAKLRADKDGGPEAIQEDLDAELDKWLAALNTIVQHMQDFYEKGEYGKGF
ncbi:glycolipid transfer protein [Macrolepiota fuliginosa MF-IS2]|uniref:Glycolipid transfer protein n=1 Tax=Macrolepiota fuliginosa MF-IS2 TaxID=1400762 RepID=A0A9P6C8B8_9AGAR|nr:glycolipid transfer protein [Macrolepiota fuliginosa MF-IS2]